MSRLTPGAIGSITVSGSDGAIQDGADTAIKATVRDYTNSNPLAVVLTDTTGDSITSLSVNTELPSAAALSDDFANPTAPAVGAFLMGWDGSTWDRIRAITPGDGDPIAISARVNSTLSLYNGTTLDLARGVGDNADDVATNANGRLLVVNRNTIFDGSTWDRLRGNSVTGLFAGGAIAHDTADTGNPLKIGLIAYSPDGSTPGTAVAELDRTNAKGDLDGRLLTNDEHPRWWSYHLNTSTAQTDTSVQADPGDGFQIVITDIQFSNGAATAINMFLEEGSTTIWGPVYLEAINGRGYVWKGKKHVTASTALTLTTSSSTAHSVEILGYIQAV